MARETGSDVGCHRSEARTEARAVGPGAPPAGEPGPMKLTATLVSPEAEDFDLFVAGNIASDAFDWATLPWTLLVQGNL